MASKDRRGSKGSAYLALLFVQAAFGSFHVVAKDLLSSVHPLALAGFRVLFATPILFLIAWRVEGVRPARRDLPILAAIGFSGVFVNQLLFILGLNHTTATNAGILMPSIPVFTAAWAAVLGVEFMSARRVAGVALAVIGSLVMLDVTHFSLGGGTVLGNLLILVNCASYAFFLVIQKPVLDRIPAWTVMAWAYLFGGLGIVAIGGGKMIEAAQAGVAPKALLEFAHVVVFCSILAYGANTWAIGRSSSTLAATFTTLQTFITALLAVPFLGEKIGWREAGGALLIIGGLLVVTLSNGRGKQGALEEERKAAG